jgi:hypothetical protein
VEKEQGQAAPNDADDASAGQPAARPVYRKPVIRKYDQIDQVKPYGPSEREAG